MRGPLSAVRPSGNNRNIPTEAANRILVVDFYNQFFNEHDISAAAVIADDYTQHNPRHPDGKESFVRYFSEFFVQNPESRVRVVRSATDADLVYLHVHFARRPQDRGRAIVAIFRVEGGKIVEYWDVTQDVPETPANSNTMF